MYYGILFYNSYGGNYYLVGGPDQQPWKCVWFDQQHPRAATAAVTPCLSASKITSVGSPRSSLKLALFKKVLVPTVIPDRWCIRTTPVRTSCFGVIPPLPFDEDNGEFDDDGMKGQGRFIYPDGRSCVLRTRASSGRTSSTATAKSHSGIWEATPSKTSEAACYACRLARLRCVGWAHHGSVHAKELNE